LEKRKKSRKSGDIVDANREKDLKQQFSKRVEKASPKSTFFKDYVSAFIVGGLICIVGQLVSNYFKSLGMPKDDVSAFTSTVMVFLGAFLTGIGVYDNLGKHAGAGSIVPITGFANSIVSPAMEFKREGAVFGIGAKMFVIAGPVLVFGISTSIIVGLIYYFTK
jgi:stage V sporulation protein AC